MIQNYCFEIRLYPDAKNRVKPAVELDAKRLLRTDIYHKVVPGDLVEKPGYRGILWHRCVGSNNAVDLLSVSASVNAPQMGDKRRRPILPIKRTRARYGEKKKKKKNRERKGRKRKKGEDMDKLKNRFHENRVGILWSWKTWNAFLWHM